MERERERESFKRPTVEVFDLSDEVIVTSGCGCSAFEGFNINDGGVSCGGGSITNCTSVCEDF